MLYYPKMPDSRGCPGGPCIAFEKYDGTNLHWDWDRDFGWHSFGTRRDRFNLDYTGTLEFNAHHPGLEEAPKVFESTWADSLAEVFRANPAFASLQDIRIFAEFLGDQSFAGEHVAGDPKRLVLFDVLIDPVKNAQWKDRGFLPPDAFVSLLGHLPIARVVYRGKFTGQLTEDVRKGLFNVAEGVVIKGLKGGWQVKVKTDAYQARLKEALGEHWVDYWE